MHLDRESPLPHLSLAKQPWVSLYLSKLQI
jgi:hypothetical protein